MSTGRLGTGLTARLGGYFLSGSEISAESKSPPQCLQRERTGRLRWTGTEELSRDMTSMTLKTTSLIVLPERIHRIAGAAERNCQSIVRISGEVANWNCLHVQQ